MALNFPYTHLCLPVAGITGVQAHIWCQAALGIKLRASGTVNKLSTNRAISPETKKNVFSIWGFCFIREPGSGGRGWEEAETGLIES